MSTSSEPCPEIAGRRAAGGLLGLLRVRGGRG